MKHPVQPRPGVGDDIVYYKKSWWFRWLPHNWKVGWYPYANVASARNRQVERLNKACSTAHDLLREWAEFEALVQKDSAFIKGSSFNGLGIGAVDYMTTKELSIMYPLCGEVEPQFKTFILKHVIDETLSKVGVKKSSHSKKPKRADMIVTTVEGSKSLQSDDTEHVVAWRAEKEGRNKSKQGGKGDKGKGQLNQLKQVFKKDDDETKEEWTTRLQDMIDEEG